MRSEGPRGRDCPRSIGRRQSGSPAASWHWYCKHLGGCCQILLHWTSSASGDVVLSISTWLCRLFLVHPSRAATPAGVCLCCRRHRGRRFGRPQCTINDSVSFSRRPARPAHGRRPPHASRNIYLLGVGVVTFIRSKATGHTTSTDPSRQVPLHYERRRSA